MIDLAGTTDPRIARSKRVSTLPRQELPYSQWEARLGEWLWHYATLTLRQLNFNKRALKLIYDKGTSARDAAEWLISCLKR